MTTALSFDFSKQAVLNKGANVHKLPASATIAQTAADFLLAFHGALPQAKGDPVIDEFSKALNDEFSDHKVIRPLINYATRNDKTYSQPKALQGAYPKVHKSPFVKIYAAIQDILKDRPDYLEALRKIGITIELPDPSLEEAPDPSLEAYKIPNTLPQTPYDPADAEDQNILFGDGSFEHWLKKHFKTMERFDDVFQRLRIQRSLHKVDHQRGERHAHRYGNVNYGGPLKASYLGPLLRKATCTTEKECDESTLRTRLARAFMQHAKLSLKETTVAGVSVGSAMGSADYADAEPT